MFTADQHGRASQILRAKAMHALDRNTKVGLMKSANSFDALAKLAKPMKPADPMKVLDPMQPPPKKTPHQPKMFQLKQLPKVRNALRG